MNPIQWIKTFIRVVREHDRQSRGTLSRFEAIEQELAEARRLMRNAIKEAQDSRAAATKLLDEIRQATDIAVDVGFKKEMTTVITVGHYRGGDYVQAFSIAPDDMAGLLDQLHRLERTGVIRRLDAPPEFRAFALREFPSLSDRGTRGRY